MCRSPPRPRPGSAARRDAGAFGRGRGAPRAGQRAAANRHRRARRADARRRLVEAGDEQRLRLREQLRGARNDSSTCRTSWPRPPLAATARRPPHSSSSSTNSTARADLARFAQGVHPKALIQHGLAVALGELAGQAMVPVALEVPTRRFAAPQEAAVFFLCSEALTNVAKYADASSVSIDVVEVGSRLVVCVADDGRGGANPVRGSGLRGLADRVEALGGTLSVTSKLGMGARSRSRAADRDGGLVTAAGAECSRRWP